MANKYKKQLQLSLPTVRVYQAIEDQLLINIAKRLKKNKSLMTESGAHAWQVKKLAELDSLSQENVKDIAKKSGLAIDEVSKALEEAGYSTVKGMEDDLQEAVRKGKAVKAPKIAESQALKSILLAYQEQAKETFNLVNSTLLNQSEQVYKDILNKTVGLVATGNKTPTAALRETTRAWADQGVPALVDRAGKRWSTEAYVSLVTRTMTNNIANDMQMARMDEHEIDLVEVSSHADSRPEHIDFQGRIFSRSGESRKYPPLSETGYGEPDGIGGVNCAHILFPYIEGVSERRPMDQTKAEAKKGYKEQQKQRYLERRVRQAKREREMMRHMGDEKGLEQAKKLVRQRQAEVRAFVNKTGRTRRYAREYVAS